MDAPPPAAPDIAAASDLIRVMAFDPTIGVVDVDAHMAELKDTARARGYPFDRHTVRNELQAATFRLRDPRTIRLLVSPTGTIAVEVSAAL